MTRRRERREERGETKANSAHYPVSLPVVVSWVAWLLRVSIYQILSVLILVIRHYQLYKIKKKLASRGGKRAQKTPNTPKPWGAEQKNPQLPQGSHIVEARAHKSCYKKRK